MGELSSCHGLVSRHGSPGDSGAGPGPAQHGAVRSLEPGCPAAAARGAVSQWASAGSQKCASKLDPSREAGAPDRKRRPRPHHRCRSLPFKFKLSRAGSGRTFNAGQAPVALCSLARYLHEPNSRRIASISRFDSSYCNAQSKRTSLLPGTKATDQVKARQRVSLLACMESKSSSDGSAAMASSSFFRATFGLGTFFANSRALCKANESKAKLS